MEANMDLLMRVLADVVDRSLPGFARVIGLCDSNTMVYVLTFGQDDGDVRFTCAEVSFELIEELSAKYLEYRADSSIEIAEWVESIIKQHGFEIHHTLWG
jgi:hypothetical protein